MSQYVDATAGAVEHCENMAQQLPDLAEPYYDKMADACRQKLWHQLTLQVLEFVSRDPSKTARTIAVTEQHTFLALYDKVVTPVDSKLDPLLLAKIASHVANALVATDITASKAVLENLISKKDAIGIPATIFVQSKLALLLLNTTKEEGGGGGGGTEDSMEDSEKSVVAGVKETLDANAVQLNDLRMLSTSSRPANADQNRPTAPMSASMADLASVFAAHYEASLTYYKRVGPPEAFYEQAMQFLSYAPPPTLQQQADPAYPADVTCINNTDYYQLAVDLCLAALTGDGVYNLGQVLENQVVLLEYLQNPPTPQPESFAWLVELLQAVAAGDVPKFDTLTQTTYAAQIARQPALTHRAAAVREKLTLLALIWLVFSKGSHERVLSFEELAQALHLYKNGKPDIDQVEWVVMRALSVHLMEGSIDQVDQTVTVTWILPRVLNAAQLQSLSTSFGEWASKVKTTCDSMNTATNNNPVATGAN